MGWGTEDAAGVEVREEEDEVVVVETMAGGGQNENIHWRWPGVGGEGEGRSYHDNLSMLLGCHVNVEFCANLLGSIKYIHKYISKGPDHATIVVSSNGDIGEIHHYCNNRFPHSQEQIPSGRLVLSI